MSARDPQHGSGGKGRQESPCASWPAVLAAVASPGYSEGSSYIQTQAGEVKEDPEEEGRHTLASTHRREQRVCTHRHRPQAGPRPLPPHVPRLL